MRVVPIVLALLCTGFAASAANPARGGVPSNADADRANRAVGAALATSDNPLLQARALCLLAWPGSGSRDEVVAARARRELETFNPRYMYALQQAINEVPTRYTDEVVKTLVVQNTAVTQGRAPEFVPALIDALWVGDRAARERAVRALLGDRPPLAVQPMIDSALEYPSISGPVIEALGLMRYEQARFWLEKVMIEGSPELRPAAASSLAQIGAAALGPLKNALKAPNKETRLLAARALLPAATEYELGALYEYVERFGDDDANLTKSIKVTAANFEKAIAARDAAAAAGAPENF